MTHDVVSIAKPTDPCFSEEQPVPVPVPVPAQEIIRGLFKRIECKKVKDEIKEGYQIIFFLNCRWVGFKSPKLVK